MAIQANTGQQIVVAELDISCKIKEWRGRASCEALDTTAVCTTTGWREFVGGLRQWEITASGMQDFAVSNVDDVLGVEAIAGNLTPFSIAPSTSGGADGAVAYSGIALSVDYETFGEVGQLGPFSLSASGRGDPLIRGTVLHPSSAARTATGNGTAYQLGALSATQSIFLGLHVLSISGAPTFAVLLQSDDNSGMTSATTRITSANYSASVGSEWQQLAGAVTDDYWRVRYTVTGGTDPSISFLAVVGIATFV